MSTRDAYVAKAQAEFTEAQSGLSALAARAHEAVGAARAEGERLLHAAQDKHDEALHRLELLKRAGDESWEGIKTTFESAWTELRRALGKN